MKFKTLIIILTTVFLLHAGCGISLDTNNQNGIGNISNKNPQNNNNNQYTDAGSRPDSKSYQNTSSCHVDCWGGISCRNGIAYGSFAGAQPCSSGTSCKSYPLYQCQKGCSKNVNRFVGSHNNNSPLLCEEWREKSVGEPCQTHRECQPYHFYGNQPKGTYLRCDIKTKKCVEVTENTSDYMKECKEDVQRHAGTQITGFIESNSCTHGYCIIEDTKNCVKNGCTMPCMKNEQCPNGSTCMLNYRNINGFYRPKNNGAPVPLLGVCKPNNSNTKFQLACKN